MFQTLGYYICMPFAALVRLFYNLTGSYGLAIILFTVVIKLIMLPFQMKSKRSMVRMNRMSGKIKEIQKKYANNQAKANEEVQKLYQEEGINPMGGCLWTLIPFPILIALYSILRQPVTHFMSLTKDVALSLVDKVAAAGIDISTIATVKDGVTEFMSYGQIQMVKIINEQLPQAAEGIKGWINIDFNFIGLDLTTHPWDALKSFEFSWAVIGLVLIPILAGGFQMLMTVMTMKQNPNQEAAGQTKGMMYMMSLFSVYIAFIMPASLGVYWIAQTLLSMVQEFFMNRFYNKKIEEEERIRYERIQEERKRKQEEGRRQQEERKKLQAEEQKLSLKEKRKAAQAAKEAKAGKAGGTTEAGRVGNRPYARGRAYQESHYEEQ